MSFQASRIGVDSAGGLITGALQTFVTISGAPWAVQGAAIEDHGSGPHNSATMAEGSPFVTIAGIAAVRADHLATCGHSATGSGHVTLET